MDKKSLPDHCAAGSPQFLNLLRSVTHNLRGQAGDPWPSNSFPWIEYEDWFVHPPDEDNGEPFSWLASSVQTIESYSPPKRVQDHMNSGREPFKGSSEINVKEADGNDIPVGSISVEDDFELVLDSGNPGQSIQPTTDCGKAATNISSQFKSDHERAEATDSCNETSGSSCEDSGLFRKLGMNRFIDCDFD